MKYDVKDLSLADDGAMRIEWDARQMPVLQSIKERFAREQPFKGLRSGVCLHISTKTANLVIAVKAGGADLMVCASNPLSTQDDVAASLVKHHDIPMFAKKGEDEETFKRHLRTVMEDRPMLLMDDGADLVTTAHLEYQDQLGEIIGATEETTTGVIRLRSMAKNGDLTFPVVAVNDSDTKHLFDTALVPARAPSMASFGRLISYWQAKSWWSAGMAGVVVVWPPAPAVWAPL